MGSRRTFLKSVAGTATTIAAAETRAAPARAAAGHAPDLVLEPDMEGTGLSFAVDGIAGKRGRPSVTLLVGPGEERTVLPAEAPIGRGSARRDTPHGPALDEWWEWKAGDHRWRWTLSRLERHRGFTLRARFRNGGREPVRLAELNLCALPEGSLVCAGDPSRWFLLPVNGQLRAGSLGETLLPASHPRWSGFGGPSRRHLPPEYASDGRWRIYDEVVTLYTDEGRRGLVIGPVGAPEANVRLDFKVDGGALRLDVVSEMSDVVVDPGEGRDSQEVLVLAESYRPALETLFRGWAATHGARLHRGPVTGWCSWYDRLDKIDGPHVEAVAEAVRGMGERLRVRTIQVDMGYERAWGDWRTNDKFPGGWPPVVDRIRQAGAVPGIWLASLAVRRSAGDVQREHPDWFQKRNGDEATTDTADGKIVAKGEDERYLDPTHPGARQFLREIVREKRREGFEYFKIDYNEISHDCRFHDPKKTRFQAFRELYQLYREEIGDGYLLACSELTRAVMGHADAVRVGWDSRAFWDFRPGAPPICLKEALRCVGQSALANGLCWANDPDVTYLVPRDTIDLEELRTWHGFVGLLGGTVMISEALDRPELQAAARMYEILVPPVRDKGWSHRGGTDREHQQFGFLADRPWGPFAVVQLYNAGDRPAARSLDLSPLAPLGPRFHVWSFWEELYLGVGADGFATRALAPHAAVVLRLTPVADDPDTPVLVGSTLHIGMGSAEVEAIASRPGEIVIELNDGGAREGVLVVYSRGPLERVAADHCSVGEAVGVGDSTWKIPIGDREGGARQRVRLGREARR